MKKWFLIGLLISWFGFQQYMASNDQETGRVQYQLIKERGSLPQYGSCWKSGIIFLERGCKYLTEETQSEIALHLTNCFLAMSGHDTYKCHSDRKFNLRAICISNMPDRAFNVYTEFYTHTQNICGFLQGHVWQEIIAENTVMVGKRLKETAQNQEGLLKAQKESLKLQEKMLEHSRFLENVLEDLFISFKEHRHILDILSRTVSNLQDWIIGEMSWLDSVLFYTVSVILVFIVTSSYRTSSARLLIFFLLFLNFLMERLICSICIFFSSEDSTYLYSRVHNYIWLCRYGFMFFATFILIYFAIVHKDYSKKQFEILCSIQDQNSTILKILQSPKVSENNGFERVDKVFVNSINENIKSMDESLKDSKSLKNNFNHIQQEYEYAKMVKTEINLRRNNINYLTTPDNNTFLNGKINNQINKADGSVERYNLRRKPKSDSPIK